MQNLNSNENLDKIKKEYENKISTINKKVKYYFINFIHNVI